MMKQSIVMVCLAAVGASSSLAYAKDTPQRRDIDARSRSSIVGKGAVKRITRDRRQDGARVVDALKASTLVNELDGQESARKNTDGSLRIDNPKGWYLEVSSNGDVAQYYRAASAKGRDVDKRESDEALIERARALVVGDLANTLSIKKNELYPVQVRHQIHESGARGSNAVTSRQLVSSEVVFGRLLDGIPVIGPGSKIFVELSADGELLSFRYDWSSVVAAKEDVAVATGATVLQRATKHTKLSAKKVEDFTRFECGYYDPGAAQSTNDLQPACLIQNVNRDDAGHITLAIEEYVPAGTKVDSNPVWPLSQVINGFPTGAAVGVPPAGPSKP